ncbi:MAG: FAD-binding oxidoreductase [Flavisolibacter sp.]|nr:FAD-binding oxidoreductase [Flavisolibacter sp.]
MHLSYWELKNWFTNIDHTIVGSGIVGLNAALRLRQKFPKSKILILERGTLPLGASTKNAGFACFGSLSEIVEDLKVHSQQETATLIKKRWQGLSILRKLLGDKAIDFRQYGGYEIFINEDEELNECLLKIEMVNEMLRPLFKSQVYSPIQNSFGFHGIDETMIYNPFEGQIDTGNMMQELIKKAVAQNILLLNNQEVTGYISKENGVEVALGSFSFISKNLFFATNGFAQKLTLEDVKPARAQVLITKPIPGLHLKGTFHFDKGYYYFRNVEDRILFGGGRNLDFSSEQTTEFGQTELIQNRLEQLLKEVILPHIDIEIDHRWSGIMGMGPQKIPIVKQIDHHVYCGIRLSGMGIAIGSIVGQELADLI